MNTLKLNIISLVILSFVSLSSNAQSTNLPDGKGEAPSKFLSFMQNNGQIGDQNNSLVPNVKYGFIQGILQGYASLDGRFSFVSTKKDTMPNDTTTSDSLLRADMVLVNSSEGIITAVTADPTGYDLAPGVHHFTTEVCPNGVNNVPSYKRLIYPSVYPDIDYHNIQQQCWFQILFRNKTRWKPR